MCVWCVVCGVCTGFYYLIHEVIAIFMCLIINFIMYMYTTFAAESICV